ncbi:2683_t:CDS:10, partial [Racocetra persica]
MLVRQDVKGSYDNNGHIQQSTSTPQHQFYKQNISFSQLGANPNKGISTSKILEERGEKINPNIFKLENSKSIQDYLEKEKITYEIYEKKGKRLDEFTQTLGVSRRIPRELRKAYRRLIEAREDYNRNNIAAAEDDIEVIKDELLEGDRRLRTEDVQKLCRTLLVDILKYVQQLKEENTELKQQLQAQAEIAPKQKTFIQQTIARKLTITPPLPQEKRKQNNSNSQKKTENKRKTFQEAKRKIYYKFLCKCGTGFNDFPEMDLNEELNFIEVYLASAVINFLPPCFAEFDNERDSEKVLEGHREELCEKCKLLGRHCGSELDQQEQISQIGYVPPFRKCNAKTNKDKQLSDKKEKYLKNYPLHYAVSRGDLDKTKEILQSKTVEIESRDHNDFTPLHIAAGQEKYDLVIELLKHGADPNAHDDEGSTPLHFAAEGNNLRLLKCLVKNNVSSGIVNEVDPDSREASQGKIKNILRERGSSYVARYEKLLERVQQEENFNQQSILPEEAIESVNQGDIDSLTKILTARPEIINHKDEDNNSLLHYAVIKDKKEIVKLLLEKGINIESRDYFASTPLHITARNANLELAKLLVESGANVKGVPTEIVTEGGYSVSDVFRLRDGSYADIYEKIKERISETGTKKEKNAEEKKKLEEEIKKDLNSLLPEEGSVDYELIKSLLETMALNQKQLVKSYDELTRANLNLIKELAFSKNLEKEKIENFCQKVAQLAEIALKENNIEFVEEQGK